MNWNWRYQSDQLLHGTCRLIQLEQKILTIIATDTNSKTGKCFFGDIITSEIEGTNNWRDRTRASDRQCDRRVNSCLTISVQSPTKCYYLHIFNLSVNSRVHSVHIIMLWYHILSGRLVNTAICEYLISANLFYHACVLLLIKICPE